MAGHTGVVYPASGVLIEADCIIDCHMHANTGASAPLPLLYRQVKDNIGFGLEGSYRGFLEFLASTQFADGVNTAKLTTAEIGAHVATLNEATYAPWHESTQFAIEQHPRVLVTRTDQPQRKPLYTPMFMMPMDMEFAQIAGYAGKTIYQTVGGKLVFYNRSSGSARYEAGEIVDVSHERGKDGAWKFHSFKRQFDDTQTVLKTNPMHAFTMFFFDPRRWCRDGGDAARNFEYGPWYFPFDKVATANRTGLHIGFKMYPSLGHMPLDPQLPHLNGFYARCASEQIPILAHGSPGGMTTHEIGFYREYCESLPQFYGKTVSDFHEYMKKERFGDALPSNDGEPTIATYSRDYDVEFFNRTYVHPRAWIPVIAKYPNIKLCLAHFGGEEWTKYEKPWLQSDWIRVMIQLMNHERQPCKNIYTDLSCHNLSNTANRNNLKNFLYLLRKPELACLKERIMFGTDWYLTLLTGNDSGYYRNYCETFKQFLDDCDGPDVASELWIRFSLVNPFEFYGLGNEAVLQNMYLALKDATKPADSGVKQLLEDNYKRLCSLKQQVDRIKSALASV